MEELRQMALAYHSVATQQIKDMVEAVYKEMDPKGNGHVKFKEFSAYMETIGCQNLSSDEFFDLLKHPGDEGLSHDNVITLFYIIYSRRPFCGGNCRKFVTGMYFSCVKCFDGSGSTFSVCPRCFDGKQYKHKHKEFLDPMVILHLKRELDINKKSGTSKDDEDKEKPIGSSPPSKGKSGTSRDDEDKKKIGSSPPSKGKSGTSRDDEDKKKIGSSPPSKGKSGTSRDDEDKKKIGSSPPSKGKSGTSRDDEDKKKIGSSPPSKGKSGTSRDDEDKKKIGSSPPLKGTKHRRSKSPAVAVVTKTLPTSPASSSSSSNDKPDTSSSISNSIVPAVNQRSKQVSSISNSIVPAVNRQSTQAKMQIMIQFGQLVASIANIVVASQLCTIM